MDRAAWVESAPITSLTRICYLEQKLTFVLFIFSDKFFKVTLEYACLLLWNTNAISRISIKNSMTYPKHSQIHFLTGNLLHTRSCGENVSPLFREDFAMAMQQILEEGKNISRILSCRTFFRIFMDIQAAVYLLLSFSTAFNTRDSTARSPIWKRRNLLSM